MLSFFFFCKFLGNFRFVFSFRYFSIGEWFCFDRLACIPDYSGILYLVVLLSYRMQKIAIAGYTGTWKYASRGFTTYGSLSLDVLSYVKE